MAAILFVVGLAAFYFVMVIQNSRLVARTLVELQTYTRLVVDHVPEGLITTDLVGRITAVNRPATALLGLNEARLMRRPIEEIFENRPPFFWTGPCFPTGA